MLGAKVKPEAEFLAQLARCRRFGHAYLVYGRFLGMIDTGKDAGRMKGVGTASSGGSYDIDLPSVMASGWLAEDGSLGVAIVNMADEAKTAHLRLPLQEAGLYAKRACGSSRRR